MATTEKRVVSLTLDAKQFASQIAGIRTQLGGVRAASEATQKSISNIASTLSVVSKATAAAYAVTRITDFVGKIQDMNNVLRSVTGTGADFARVQSKIFEISNKTGAAVDATAGAYARIARALQGTGKTSADALVITERLNKALLVSGASAGEAASALTQFSQALQSGKLQGDEFRSLTENAPLVIDAIVKMTGQSKSALKGLASEGKLTADLIVQALTGEMGNAIDVAAADFEKTLPQALNIARTNFIKLVTESPAVVSVLGLVAKAVIAVSEHFVAFGVILTAFVARTAIVAALTALASGAGLAGAAMALLPARFVAAGLTADGAAAGVGFLSGALVTLRTVLASTGVGLIVIALGLLGDKLYSTAQSTKTLSEFLSRLAIDFKALLATVIDFAAVLGSLPARFLASLVALVTGFDGLKNVIQKSDEYLQKLTGNLRKDSEEADANAVATANAEEAKRAFAEATREATAALNREREALVDNTAAAAQKVVEVQAQIAAYKKGGDAAVKALEAEQEITRKVGDERKRLASIGVMGRTKEDEVALNAYKQQLTEVASAEATLEKVRSAKKPRAEKKEREYETLPQILKEITARAAEAQGALAAFNTGGAAGLEAFNNAQERQVAIEQVLADVKKNKISQSAAERQALIDTTTATIALSQANEKALKVAQEQRDLDTRAKNIKEQANQLIAARNVLITQGVDAYQKYLDNLDTQLKAESELGPRINDTTEKMRERRAEVEASIQKGKDALISSTAIQDQMKQRAQDLTSVFTNFFDSVASGAVTFKQAIKDMIRELLILIIKMLIFNALANSSNGFLSSVGLAGGGIKKSSPLGTSGGTKSLATYSATASTAAAVQSSAYGGKSASAGNTVSVVVNNNASGVGVSTQTRDDGKMIEITVDRIAAMVARGGNKVSQAMEKTYALNRGAGAFS